MAAGLVVAVLAVAPAVPAAATDDGDDVSDLLVDEVAGYELQPPGDPLEGLSGPLNWDDLGPIAGVGSEDLPDLPGYANAFLASDNSVYAMVMGIDVGDLDESAVLAGAGAGLTQFGDGDELTLPNADAAGVDYEAGVMTPPGAPRDATLSGAALAGEGIVVIVFVTSMDGNAAEERRVLDRFVVAQAQFEPPVAAPPARPRRIDPTRRVAIGDERSSARMAGAIISWTLLTVGFALLAGFLVRRWQSTRTAAAASAPAAGWSQATGSTGSWPPASGPSPTAASPTTGPPLPPSAGPPLAPSARRRLPPPPPPLALPLPPAVPPGGFGAARRASPPSDALPAADPGNAGSSDDGWILPG